jgi:hypothetical protein
MILSWVVSRELGSSDLRHVSYISMVRHWMSQKITPSPHLQLRQTLG